MGIGFGADAVPLTAPALPGWQTVGIIRSHKPGKVAGKSLGEGEVSTADLTPQTMQARETDISTVVDGREVEADGVGVPLGARQVTRRLLLEIARCL